MMGFSPEGEKKYQRIYSQVVMDVGHVGSVGECFLVGPLCLLLLALGAEDVGQVAVGCRGGERGRRS